MPLYLQLSLFELNVTARESKLTAPLTQSGPKRERSAAVHQLQGVQLQPRCSHCFQPVFFFPGQVHLFSRELKSSCEVFLSGVGFVLWGSWMSEQRFAGNRCWDTSVLISPLARLKAHQWAWSCIFVVRLDRFLSSVWTNGSRWRGLVCKYWEMHSVCSWRVVT